MALPAENAKENPEQTANPLASWIVSRVEAWEQFRDDNYKKRWDEYYRMYRGLWTEQDRQRPSERSRIMGTELAQAIETTVAELESAIFAKDRWVDIVDDADDQEKQDTTKALSTLLDEYEIYGVREAVSEILLNGTLYGTGIGKIMVDKVEKPVFMKDSSGMPSTSTSVEYCVKLIPVSPRNFVIDPYAKTPSEGLGCAHVWASPMAECHKKMSQGYYKRVPLGPYHNAIEDKHSLGETTHQDEYTQMCKIIEWHGMVPEDLLNDFEAGKEEAEDELAKAIKAFSSDDLPEYKSYGDMGQDNLVEAIVTVLNDNEVVRATKNPFMFADRSFIAYQHDTVPDRFWGRGGSEKGFNPQKALDGEIRARMDALSYSTNPMMGVDSTKIPRGEKFASKPGKNFFTIGNPAESLMPLKFPPPDPHTFQQTQELREMIQRGTGAYELPANTDNSRMAATAMSMVVGSMLKRSQRTLHNIERNLLTPLVKKSLWRYIQFAPDKFQLKDYRFKVKAAMGMMAREFEQGQMVSLLSNVPAEDPAFWMVMKTIYENSSTESRDAMVEYAERKLEEAMNPQPAPPPPEVLVEQQKLEQEMAIHKDKMDIEVRKLMQQDEMIRAEARRDEGEGRMQTATAALQMVKAETEQMRAQTESMLNLAKAEGEKVKAELETYKAALEEAKVGMEAAASDAASKATTEATNKATTAAKESLEPAISGLKELLLTSLAQMQNDISATKGLDDVALKKVLEDIGAFRPPDMSGVENRLSELEGMLQANQKRASNETEEDGPSESDPVSDALGGGDGATIERDENGLVTSINGKPVKRGSDGLISGV